VLAKLTSKNQLTLPKSVTDSLGPVQYFEVQVQAGQVVLTPVRIQRGDAVRAKLAELELGEELFADALAWAAEAPAAASRPKRKAAVAAPRPSKVAVKATPKATVKGSGTKKAVKTAKVAAVAAAPKAAKATKRRPAA